MGGFSHKELIEDETLSLENSLEFPAASALPILPQLHGRYTSLKTTPDVGQRRSRFNNSQVKETGGLLRPSRRGGARAAIRERP